MSGNDANSSVKSKHRILIVDKHPVIRWGLASLLADEPDLVLAGEHHNGSKALQLLESGKFDLGIVDLRLDGLDGLDLVRTLRKTRPDLPILVYSSNDERVYAERSLRSGARGFVGKHAERDELLQAIRRVLTGQVYVSDSISSKIVERLAGNTGMMEVPTLDRLTDRELQVLSYLGHGMGSREVSERLSLSIKTIDTHRENIKKKLRLKSATELVQYAVRSVESGLL